MESKLVEYVRFYSEDGEFLGEETNTVCCQPWSGGDYNGHCGGCYSCLILQGYHSGCILVFGECYEDRLFSR